MDVATSAPFLVSGPECSHAKEDEMLREAYEWAVEQVHYKDLRTRTADRLSMIAANEKNIPQRHAGHTPGASLPGNTLVVLPTMAEGKI